MAELRRCAWSPDCCSIPPEGQRYCTRHSPEGPPHGVREQSALELLETHAKALEAENERLREELLVQKGCRYAAEKMGQQDIEKIGRLRAALEKAADTFADLRKGFTMMQKPLLVASCQIAEEATREALRGAVETAAEPPPTPQWLAVQFHETYERLAPKFGYETRTGTRQFDPESPNGRLMMAVCAELLAREPALSRAAVETTPKYGTCAVCGGVGGAHSTYCKDSPLKAAARQRQD